MITGYFNVVALQAAEKLPRVTFFVIVLTLKSFTKHADFCCNAVSH